MSQPAGHRTQAPVATFQARVASVGLITTVVVLLAACGAFLLQQWAVAQTQSEQTYQGLATITARSIAPAVAEGRTELLQESLASLGASERVVSARLVAADGETLAMYHSAGPRGAAPLYVLTAPVQVAGKTAGELSLSVTKPTIGPMLPKFLALTFVLLFGGVGVALFLARSLAQRVIAPVQRLSEAMHAVAEGGSFEPVEVTAQDQLFRSLTDSFNHLLAKLGQREADLKSAMRELEVARDAANTANTLKTHFLANMSHEIRTPLNGVLAMAEVMAMGELAAVQRERLQIIRQSGGLLLSVLNDVLDLSKIEAGKLTLVNEPFEVRSVIAPVVESFQVMAAGKNLAFSVEVAEAVDGWWEGDADRLRQVVGNLLSNAVKFTQKGAVATVIDVSETGALRLQVRDSGIGIAPAKLPSLFEKFTQADNSATRRFGGTGLGLAICRELTQMMGGAIRVESQEGQGSVFTVELPLARGQAAATSEEAAPQRDDAGLRLLAAEDNPTNQQVLAAVMESLGIDIDICPDGEQVVAAWETCDYDLILMDIQMPVMDGIQAAREIRKREKKSGRSRTPIIALTANALTHQVSEYMAAGMDAHVAKPIEIAKLYEAISATLNAAATGAGAKSAAA